MMEQASQCSARNAQIEKWCYNTLDENEETKKKSEYKKVTVGTHRCGDVIRYDWQCVIAGVVLVN